MDPCDNLSRVFRVGTRKSLPLRAHLLSEVSGLTSNKAKIEPPCDQREELKHTLPLKQHLSARCHVFRGTNAGLLDFVYLLWRCLENAVTFALKITKSLKTLSSTLIYKQILPQPWEKHTDLTKITFNTPWKIASSHRIRRK